MYFNFFKLLNPYCLSTFRLFSNTKKNRQNTTLTGKMFCPFLKCYLSKFTNQLFANQGKKGHTIGITTRDTTKHTPTRPQPHFT